MFKHVVLAVIVLSFLANIASAKSKISYDTKPFEINVSKVPVSYNGHDAEKILKELYKLKNLKKDTYETTNDFNNRVSRRNHQPIYAKVSTTALLAHVAQLDQEYDADKGTLLLSNSVDEKGEILAAFNNYNSSTRIHCEFYNLKTDILNNIAFNKYVSKGKFTIAMQNIPPQKAKSYKNKIYILYAYRIYDPNAIDGFGQHWTTGIQETTTNSYSLPVNVSQIWIFNKSTGEIIYRLK